MQQFTLRDGFAAESPFLDGHFPGNPIVPGAITLAYLAYCLAAERLLVERVKRMKFVRPLRPEVFVEIVVTGSRGEAREDGSLDARASFSDPDGVFAIATLELRRIDD